MPSTHGTLHTYHPARNLNVLEHLPYPSTSTPHFPAPPPKHILLFIGGLYDTFNTPQYTLDIASLFPIHEHQTWRVLHVQLSSNGRSWGIFDIDRDIEEIALCIAFLRDELFKDPELDVVLMGHSTGCQDVMRYLTAPNPSGERGVVRPVVQGAILQAPVSDRDAVMHAAREGPSAKKAYDEAIRICNATAEKDRRDVILPLNLMKPLFGPCPVSVARFLSLASPGSPETPSVEDFFSADLSESTQRVTFGNIGRNKMLCRRTGDGPRDTQYLLVLMSDSDEYAQPQASQKQTLQKWKMVMREDTGAMVHGDSAVILNALHDVGGSDWPSQEARLVVLRKKVLHYLRDTVGDVGKGADDIWHKDGDRVMAMKVGDGRSAEDMVGVLKL